MRRTIIILSSVLGFCLLLVAGWFFYQSWSGRHADTSSSQQAPSSTPEPTTAPPSSPAQPTTMTFVSPKGVQATLDNWLPMMRMKSAQTVTGTVPGNWSFEASFPVELLDQAGNTLTKTPAHLTGDWMTTQQVPFTVTLSFTAPTSGTGVLRLHKDNPSGQPANDDSIDVPVQFSP